jgi:hypothetical protein
MGLAVHVQSDGKNVVVKPKNGKEFTLEEAQAYVGGYVEIAPTMPDIGCILLVNEEGHMRGLPHNEVASKVAAQHIVGDALYCPANMFT